MNGMLGDLALGFSVALSLTNLAFCFLGALIGTLIGVLPGIGPVATVAILLPVTFGLEPVTGLIMLAGIYYGAQYGGSTTSILLNLPGEASSVVTCLEGNQLAKRGRGGAALAIAALGSFFAGCVATAAIAMLGPILSGVALSFRPADYCMLMVFGLVCCVVLANGSALKAVAMVLVGILIGLVGTDPHSAAQRYTFGLMDLYDGVSFVAVAMGLFGIGEIINNLEKPQGEAGKVSRIGRLWPTREDFRRSWKPSVRGTALGSFLGLLPGGGAMIASFASYALEKRIAGPKSEFGSGAIEGVAGPESANNAGAQLSFVPLLTLGIPSNALIALMAGAMMVHNVVPGPQVMTRNPEIFWGLIASMWIGNLMLVIINLPLIGLWVSMLRIPYRLLFPAILVFCAIGAFGESFSSSNILMVAVFALAGYGFTKLGAESAPLILGMILGPLMEDNLRRALQYSRGDWSVFVQEPISLFFLVLSLALVAMMVLPNFRRTREEAFQEG